MSRGQRPLMNPPPMTWTRSICAASSIPACQRGATPGSLMARCTNAATAHGSSDGASQHNRQNVRETHTGMEVPQQHAASPGLGQSTHTCLVGAVRARYFSHAASMISSP